MKEPILIISYTFPPAKGIGGRRWAKFARYMADEGHPVHVICHEPLERSQLFNEVLEDSRIHITRIQSFYPSVLRSSPKSLIDKLRYRFWMKYLSWSQKGSIYDTSIYMRKPLQSAIRAVVQEHGIKRVFMTLAPFKQVECVLDLKQALDLHLTVDLRDPWTWGQGYGYATMSPERKAHDEQLEQRMMAEADCVTAPSQDIIEHLAHRYAQHAAKLLHVPHAVDVSAFPQDLSRPEHNAPALRFIYAGTLYEGYAAFVEQVCKALDSLHDDRPEHYAAFHFDIYSMGDTRAISNLVAGLGHQDKIKVHEAIPEQQLFAQLRDYDYALIYFPDRYTDFISTKFYELIYARIPICYVGSDGRVARFIQEQGLGIHTQLRALTGNALAQIAERQTPEGIAAFDISPYLFPAVTRALLQAGD